MGNAVLVREGKFLNMFRTNNGWEFVSRKTIPFADGNGKPDAVIIIPLVVDDGHLKIVFTREWREPLGCWVWGFPAGLVDEGETFTRAGIRELKEETGLNAVRVLKEIPPVFSSEGLTDECVATIYVAADGEISNKYLQDNEQIVTQLVDREMAESIIITADVSPMGKVAYFVLQDFVNTGFSWLFEKEKWDERQAFGA